MRRHIPLAVVLLCGALLAAARATETVDLKLLDLQFRLLRAWFPQPLAREVVVVGIDEDTARLLPEPITLWHHHLRRFLGAMARAKPAVVGFDIVLPDRSYEQVAPGSDREVMSGLLEARKSFPLVLALTVDPAGNRRPVHPPFLTLAGPEGTGYVQFPLDRDGVVRRFDEHLPGASGPVPTLVGQMARHLGLNPQAGVIDYWRGTPFRYVPFHQVLRWWAEQDEEALGNAFRGKPVMLGTVFQFEDRLPTPVRLAASDPEGSTTPGVMLQAQALSNLLNGGFIRRVPTAVIVVLSIFAALLWFISSTMAGVAALAITLFVLLLACSTWLLTQGWFAPLLMPALTGAAALSGRQGYDTLLKLRERRRLRASFSGYVSPAILEEILAGRIRPELGGERALVCVMFADIRGYTTRSERMTPEEVIRFLNRYFERVVALIHERGGSVVSFMGDGIMAVFGAPKPLEHPSREAFDAACAMLKYVAELNRQLGTEGESAMDIGIGLNSGEAVVGHIGASSRHDYSAIGDVPNVAARVEGLTKEAGYHVVVTKTVADELGPVAQLVPLGTMAIKGHTPVEVYGYDKIVT
jgi:adenylate cyclase